MMPITIKPNGSIIFGVNDAWLPSQKAEYTFLNNIATTEILYSWDEMINNWKQSYRYTYVYNTNNQLISVLGEEFSGGVFSNSSQTINITWPNAVEQTYPLTQTTQYWDASTSTWMNQNKVDCQFDVAGNMILETNYYWDAASWKLQNFTDYTYNTNLDITSAITKVDTSMAQTGQLMIQKSIKNYYNSNFNLINDTIGYFDLFWGQLSIIIDANTYTYNANNNLLNDTIFTLNTTTNAFEKRSLFKNYYYANTTNLTQNTQGLVSLFPNPVVNYLNVNNTTGNEMVLNIYNQLGKLVASETIEKSNHTVDVTNYAKGIYLVQYTLPNGNIGTSKFVK